MDEVLCDLRTPWIERYNRDYNDNKTPDDLTEWNMISFVKPECGGKIFKYLNEPGFFFNLKPIEGAIDTVNYLIELLGKDKIYICTTSPIGGFDDKQRWIEKYLPKLRNNIVFLKNKGLIARNGSMLIDDAPHNLIACKEAGGIPVCMDMPHNRNLDKEIMRVKDWSEIFSLSPWIKICLEDRIK